MSHRLSIAGPAGGDIPAEPGVTVLEAAQRQHWRVSSGCRNGNCLACGAQLIAGCARDRQGRPLPAGPILTCQTLPFSDLQLIWPGARAPGSATTARSLQCRVLASDAVAQYWSSRLELPPGRMPALLPGQWLRLGESQRLWIRGTGGSQRELLVLSSEPLPECRVGLTGPFGHCWLDARSPSPVRLLVGAGRQLQAEALRRACVHMALDETRAGPPATVLGLSDHGPQRARWRAQWQNRAALYADDDGRCFRPDGRPGADDSNREGEGVTL